MPKTATKKTAKASSKKATRKKSATAADADTERYTLNLSRLRKRRKRVKKCVSNLEKIINGDAESIDTNDIEEAVKLLRFYNARLLKAVVKNKDLLGTESSTDE